MPDRKALAWSALSVLLIVLVLLAWRTYVVDEWAQKQEKHNYTAPGQFGDSFAPVSAFFSALAFIAAVASFHSQRKALFEQGEAAIAQARALERAIEHLAGQESATRAHVDEQNRSNTIAEKQVAQATRHAALIEQQLVLANHQIKLAEQHFKAVYAQVDQLKVANGFAEKQVQLAAAQTKVQDVANDVARFAAETGALQLTAQWDREGIQALSEHVSKMTGPRLAELKKTPQEVWILLVKAMQEKRLFKEPWHNPAVSDEMMRILVNRELLEERVQRARQKLEPPQEK